MQRGFHIGADRTHLQVQRATRNLHSVVQNHQIVEQHIREETDAFRLLGPLPLQLAALCHTSPIGLIPKPVNLVNGGSSLNSEAFMVT